jgi:hypothetical protein
MWISLNDLLAENQLLIQRNLPVTEPQGTGIVFLCGQVRFGAGTGSLVKQSCTVSS